MISMLEITRTAVRALRRNKTRSMLTALGIIIGVGAVIAAFAVGAGANKSIDEQISSFGSNFIMVFPDRGAMSTSTTQRYLTYDDALAIEQQVSGIDAVAPMVNTSVTLIYGNTNWSTSVIGSTSSYSYVQDREISQGRDINDSDVRQSNKVCVIGRTIATKMFNGENPLGKMIRINKIPFQIVGIFAEKGQSQMGSDQDDLVLAPYTTVMKRILAQTYLGGIVCSAITEEASQPAQDQITEILRRNHKLKDATDTTEADEDDFNIRSQEEISSMMNSTMSTITILLGSVAGISLLVGGIGIMNIMYVSVTERTREIGLRMSVGARGVDILNQFLIEAILLSVTGGVIGVLLGVSLSVGLQQFLHVATQIDPWSIIMSFAVCTFTGVFFGWYPAKKAARLDPIEAIRYE